MENSIIVGQGRNKVELLGNMANRHGLIAGATGTGKTVTLRILAEGFSRQGVPVFLADVKGDLSGISRAGGDNPKIKERASELGLKEFKYSAFPAAFWDFFGEQGHPLRTTISEIGPLLLGRLLNLNETQAAVLTLIFKVADDQGLLLLDLKDLQSLLNYVGTNAAEFTTQYGNVSAASVGAIQRGLLNLSEQGGEKLFGEPALNIDDFLQTSPEGLGVINILAADKLMQAPKVYATFLLWLLSELYERFPEVGDLEKPKFVFFFDEAHLLFDEAPRVLLEKIEQVVRLIRSKGVGVYFITQSPTDIPDSVAAQLGNRIQHALRAFTAKDQKALKAAAETYRSDGSLDVAKTILELKVGEALVSLLDSQAAPQPVERALIYPPQSRLTPLSPEERRSIIQASLLCGHYEKQIDRESAYELLTAKAKQAAEGEAQPAAQPKSEGGFWSKILTGSGGRRQTPIEAFISSTVRSIGSQIGRQIIRGVLGSVSKSSSRR